MYVSQLVSFVQVFVLKYCVHFLCLPWRDTPLAHLRWFDSQDICRRVQIVKLFILKYCPTSWYFILLGLYILFSILFSGAIKLCSSLTPRHQIWHLYKETSVVLKIFIVMYFDRWRSKRIWIVWKQDSSSFICSQLNLQRDLLFSFHRLRHIRRIILCSYAYVTSSCDLVTRKWMKVIHWRSTGYFMMNYITRIVKSEFVFLGLSIIASNETRFHYSQHYYWTAFQLACLIVWEYISRKSVEYNWKLMFFLQIFYSDNIWRTWRQFQNFKTEVELRTN